MPSERFEKCGAEVLWLQVSHENLRLGRRHASAHGCVLDLQIIMVLKAEVVHGEDKQS